jgi:hypothetical protein
VSPSSIINFSHDHITLIRTSPNITSCAPIFHDSTSPFKPSPWLQSEAHKLRFENPDLAEPKYYSITDKNPVWNRIPGFRYQAVILDESEGLRIVVEAPGGTKLWQHWTVERKDVDKIGEEGSYQLVETTKVQCWSLFGSFVRQELERAHRENHQLILEKLSSDGNGV